MKLVHCAVVPLLALTLLGLEGNAPVESFEPTIRPGVAQTTAPGSPSPDTLRTPAEPNTPLILSLPAELNGHAVERYTLLEGPSLSGVAGRSFTWIPQGADPGTHEALLQTHTPDASPDTLVVQINLQP